MNQEKENDKCFREGGDNHCIGCNCKFGLLYRMRIYSSKNTKTKIEIDLDFFEHLLNCMANQKFIDEGPMNGDMLHETVHHIDRLRNMKMEHQSIIDTAWRDGMRLLQEVKVNK